MEKSERFYYYPVSAIYGFQELTVLAFELLCVSVLKSGSAETKQVEVGTVLKVLEWLTFKQV